MRKAVLEKRIECFKRNFPEYKTSERGSIYAVLAERKHKKVLRITGAAVTKNTLHKLGEEISYTEDMSTRLLLTKGGKLMVQFNGGKRWYNLGIAFIHQAAKKGIESSVAAKAAEIFFIGRKYEWLRSYRKLWRLKYFHGFKSLKEAKGFVGYDFISDYDFVALFEQPAMRVDVFALMLSAKTHDERVSIVRILSAKQGQLLQDLYGLYATLGRPVQAPSGKQNLKEVHDKLVDDMALQKADSYSDERVEYETELFRYWDSQGLVYTVLDSPRALFIEGNRQKHCLGSYTAYLKSQMFVSFAYQEQDYDIQLYHNGSVGQFAGRRNCTVPKELRDMVIPPAEFNKKIIVKKKEEQSVFAPPGETEWYPNTEYAQQAIDATEPIPF